MNLPELIILDVGHGNCAIVQDDDIVTIIDCPPNTILIETLEQLGIDVVNQVLISHADDDHVGGLPNLLGKVVVKSVYVNPDPSKGRNWISVREALELAKSRGTKINTSLNSGTSENISCKEVMIEILAPSEFVALGGVQGKDLEGRSLSSNSMSAVIGLVHNDYRFALLAGDIGEIGLDNLLRTQKNIEAQILVFPHHGGNADTQSNEVFAQKLCQLVNPSLTIFSYDRDRHDNPRQEIIQGVLSATPNTHVLCTQLSRKCASSLSDSNFTHVTTLPSLGVKEGKCCGGSIRVRIDGKQTTYSPTFAQHRAFINTNAPDGMCMKQLVQVTPLPSLLTPKLKNLDGAS